MNSVDWFIVYLIGSISTMLLFMFSLWLCFRHGDERDKYHASCMNVYHYIVIAILWFWFGPYLFYNMLSSLWCDEEDE